MAQLVEQRKAILRKYHPGALESKATYVRATRHPLEAKAEAKARVEAPEVRRAEPVSVKLELATPAKPTVPLAESPYARIQREAAFTPAPPVQREVERVRPVRKIEIGKRTAETVKKYYPVVKEKFEPKGKVPLVDVWKYAPPGTKRFAESALWGAGAVVVTKRLPPSILAPIEQAFTQAYLGTKVKRYPEVSKKEFVKETALELAGAAVGARLVTKPIKAPKKPSFLLTEGEKRLLAVRKKQPALIIEEVKPRVEPLEITLEVKEKTIKTKDPMEFLRGKGITPEFVTKKELAKIYHTEYKVPITEARKMVKGIRGVAYVPSPKKKITPRVWITPSAEPLTLKHEAIHVSLRESFGKKALPFLEEPYVRLRTKLPYKFKYKQPVFIEPTKPTPTFIKLLKEKKGAVDPFRGIDFSKSQFAKLSEAYKGKLSKTRFGRLAEAYKLEGPKEFVLVEEQVITGVTPTTARVGIVYPVRETRVIQTQKQLQLQRQKQIQVQQQEQVKVQRHIQKEVQKQIQEQRQIQKQVPTQRQERRARSIQRQGQEQKQIQKEVQKQIQEQRQIQKQVPIQRQRRDQLLKQLRLKPLELLERERKKPPRPSPMIPRPIKKTYAPTLWGYYGFPKVPATKDMAKMVFTGILPRPGVKFPTKKKKTKRRKRR